MKKWLLFLLIGNLLWAQEFATEDELTMEENQDLEEINPQRRIYDFNFVSTDFKSVFQAISIAAKIDVIPDPNINGQVTLKITDKTWQEALKIICDIHDLKWIIEETYIRVMLSQTYDLKQTQKRNRINNLSNIAPLVRQTFKIKHAKADELKEVFQNLLSPRGKLTIVDRNNAVIVFDTEERMEEIARALQELDVETKQIMITARLIVVDSELLNEVGVDWAARAGHSVSVSPGEVPVTDIGATNGMAEITSIPSGSPGLGKYSTQLSMGLLNNNLGVTIQQLMLDEKTEILASPQITTLDHTEAEIFMGEKISLRIIDAEGQVANQLEEAGIKLTVTPHITGDDKVLMAIKTENNDAGVDATGQPSISTQEAETNVVIRNGETVVIGGLTKNEESESESGIPFLKDIPVLGHLFKHKKKQMVKKDLIIFVTPNIISDNNDLLSFGREENAINQAPIPMETSRPGSNSGNNDALLREYEDKDYIRN